MHIGKHGQRHRQLLPQNLGDAEMGRNEFIAVFVPWYWQEEYRKEPAVDFVLDEEERAYAALYGLDDAQMAWRGVVAAVSSKWRAGSISTRCNRPVGSSR
jgi:hypothetical protein